MTDDEKFPSDLADRFQVRMPQGMRDRLIARAKAHGRSANSEAVLALKVWLDQWDWIEAKADGKKVGPWPGMIPDPLPEDLRIKVLNAAKSNGWRADDEITARLQNSFAADDSSVNTPKSIGPLLINEKEVLRILSASVNHAISDSEFAQRLKRIEDNSRRILEKTNFLVDDLPDHAKRAYREDEEKLAHDDDGQGLAVRHVITNKRFLSAEDHEKAQKGAEKE